MKAASSLSALLASNAHAGRMTVRDLQVLGMLVAHQTAVSMGSLADMFSINGFVVSRVASKLVERGLITRFDNPEDRRVTLLEPTPAGRALDAQMRSYYALLRQPPVAA